MVHPCFIEAGDRSPDWSPEPGIESALKTPQELAAMIKNGEFKQENNLNMPYRRPAEAIERFQAIYGSEEA